MKRYITLLMMLLLPLVAMAAKKEGYKITVTIDGCKDSALYMGYYLAENRYYCDTTAGNGKGKYVFEGKQDLYPGLYFLTNSKDKYVEFVVYREEQRFSFHTNDANWELSMEVKGSRENELLFNFHRAEEVLYQEMEQAHATLDSVEFSTHFMPRQRLRFDSLRLSVIERDPDCMLSRMMMATKDITIPREHPDGTAMNDRERRQWFLSHYFDNMPLDDNFIVRTPKTVFYQRVMDYVDKYLYRMPPEEVIPYLDTMIDRSEPAPEVFKWLVHTMTEHYLQSHIMVYDEIYVHLVLRYYGSGKAFWSSPSFIDQQVEQANKWSRLLVGKEAPELILFDTLRRPVSLHHMPGRYTLLLFWSPTCGHCRDIIPAVYKVFEQYRDSLDLSAFAILTEPDDNTIPKWKRFLKEHDMTSPRWINLNGGEANVDWRQVYDINTTPQIYLIDNSDHKFVAKKLNAEVFESICKALAASNGKK